MLREEKDRALLTDLYELTMAAAYFEQGDDRRAAFELFTRELPPARSYLVCAGLGQVLSYLEHLRFTSEQIDYLRALPSFKRISKSFWRYLAKFRFTGSVEAAPEGTVVFAQEPFLQVQAPIIEAQIIETFVLTALNFQTLIATKAARLVDAAGRDGRARAVVEFGTRRAHGPDAGILAARAAYIGGCQATSNVEAGFQTGIPVTGTQAHSFIMAFDRERDAFEAYARAFPDNCVLLVDTYDVEAGVRKAIEAAPKMRAIRLDSGKIDDLSRKARKLLDRAGLERTIILASGDLDEYKIAKLVDAGAPVDAFGVGTALTTSSDAPALGGVYKLVAIEEEGRWTPRLKLSPEKATYPGLKQVYRIRDPETGQFDHDLIARADETPPADAEPLLQPVMRDGRRVDPEPDLDTIRTRAEEQRQSLPPPYRRLKKAASYPVKISGPLQSDYDLLAKQLKDDSR